MAAALLLSALCIPAPARAAGEGCAVVGMFDARARALCEAAARSSQAAPAQNSAPGYGAPPANGPVQRPPIAPPPPVRPGFTRINIVGNLYVDVQGAYPDGYAPKWSGVGVPNTIPVSQTWYVNRGETRATIQQPVTLATPDGPGRAQFGFSVRDQTCYGDITGTDGPVLLTETPQTFPLTDLHMGGATRIAGCPMSNTSNRFTGMVTLSADIRGNVNVQYTINVFTIQGARQFLWEAPGFQLRNAMTPEMAVADIEHKRQVAEAAAKARAEAAERTRVRLARKLTPLEARIDKIIQQDSAGWLSNHYDVNSVTNAKLTTATKAIAAKDGVPVGAQALQAEFTQNDGRPASVDVIVIKGAVKCLQFSDETECRALGHPQSQDRMRRVTEALGRELMNPSSSSSSVGECDTTCRVNHARETGQIQ